MSDAVAAPPNAPPTVRVTVFMPVATPVCSGPTFSMIRFAIAAKARPMPAPRERRGEVDQGEVVAKNDRSTRSRPGIRGVRDRVDVAGLEALEPERVEQRRVLADEH